MEIGVIGLGRMGANMARRMARGGARVVAFDRDPAARAALAGEPKRRTASKASRRSPRSSRGERVLLVMLPAGAATEDDARANCCRCSRPATRWWTAATPSTRTRWRARWRLSQRGLRYVDAGVSGGIHGLANGYCLMLGGTPKSVERFEPFARILAPAPDRGWLHCGPSGAGHFAKMIHNGIEYGMMQAFAEGFALLAARKDLEFDLGRLAETWRHGSVVRSWLLDLSAEILKEDEDLQRIAPVVADSGEGRWTALESVELGVPAPVITHGADGALLQPGQIRLRAQTARHDAREVRRARDLKGMIVVVMGVSGSGKSTIGELLAERLGLPFLDADEFHPPENVAKMAAGTPLDRRRPPALARTAEREAARQDNAVLACSALKESYRQILRGASPTAASCTCAAASN